MHLVQLLTQHQKQHYLKDGVGTDEDQITKENFHNHFWKNTAEKSSVDSHFTLIQDKKKAIKSVKS